MDLVIGGSGFIGCHLVRELVRRGRAVRVFDVSRFPQEEETQPHELVPGDILDFKKLSDAMKGCDTVFHLAAIPMLWHRNPKMFDKVNRQGTENVLHAAKHANIQQLVYTSTESILAKRHHKGPINEDTQPSIDDMIGPYCRSKFLAEQAVFRYIADGFPAVVVSPTMPVGPGDRNLTPPARMIHDFLQGKIPAYIECTLNFVDVRDAALGHVLAAEKRPDGRRYILSGRNMHLADFFALLANITGRPAPKIKIPYSIALGWSYFEEFTCKITGRVPSSSVTGVKLCRRSLTFDGSKTWQRLGHTPRPIEESVRDAVDWFQKCLTAQSHIP